MVELLAREKNVLKVKGLDAIDGTPLLDIKPYIPSIDEKTNVEAGWLKDRLKVKNGGEKARKEKIDEKI